MESESSINCCCATSTAGFLEKKIVIALLKAEAIAPPIIAKKFLNLANGVNGFEAADADPSSCGKTLDGSIWIRHAYFIDKYNFYFDADVQNRTADLLITKR